VKGQRLERPRARDRLRLAIDVADPAFADWIASVLADVEGLELVGKDDEPDALVVAALGAATELEANIELTARELEVLALLAEGASNKLIARRLGISAHTAKYHVASLLEKLDAVSRTDAVAHAARIGVLHL
jgi:DNA-binding CsgD family transcriptional regulator